MVTPLVGVWIEMLIVLIFASPVPVTPLVVVCIEIYKRLHKFPAYLVTPLVGVWIEMF